MIKSVRKAALRLLVTPSRVRRLVACIVSAFLQWAADTRAGEAVAALPRWLRRLADFIDCWNAASLPSDRDDLIAGLVGYAVTDEAVGKLIDAVVSMDAQVGARVPTRSELVTSIKEAARHAPVR